MTVNSAILYRTEIRDYNVLFNLLLEVKYYEKSIIQQIERHAYNTMRELGEDVNGLVVIAIAEQMLGNRQKSVAIAHNIWDKGGNFKEYAFIGYANLLINLGLFDMASILLKPKFEALDLSANRYFYVMLKFSVLTGNINLIDKLLSYANPDDDVNMLSEFTEVYKDENYAEHYKKIQKILIEACKDYVCAYEYSLYYDRGFTDVEITVYFNKDISDIKSLYRNIETEIEEYFSSIMVDRIYNLGFVIKGIEDHPASIA